MALLDPSAAAMLFNADHEWRDAGLWRRVARRFSDAALDFVFPPHCTSCGTPLPEFINKVLCIACSEQVRWIGADRCMRCGDSVGSGMGAVPQCVSCRTHPPRFINASIAALRYEEGPGRDLILGLKFGGKDHLAATLGKILALRVAQTGVLIDLSRVVVVPAPLMRGALFKRGYNQAEELARVVAHELKLKMDARLLMKIRATRPQAMLSAQQRRKNVVGAFACVAKRANYHKGSTLLLVDDVITTGSTVSECARMLHEAGFKTIVAAAVARG